MEGRMIRKQSKQRDVILNYMKNVQGHVRAEQIFKDLNENGNQISLATIYRNLDVLTQMHKIKKIAHPVNGYVYDKTCAPHYHLHCTVCDELYDFPFPYMNAFDARMEEESGWQIHAHSIVFEGICPNCKKANRS